MNLNKHKFLELRQDVPNRTAAVTVELALTIGLAFFFFFAAFEFCRVSMLRHTIETAVYEGARAAIVPGGTKQDVQDKVKFTLKTVGIRNSSTKVTPETLTLNTPTVTVQVEVPIKGNMYLPPMFFKDNTLRRSIDMQRETPATAKK